MSEVADEDKCEDCLVEFDVASKGIYKSSKLVAVVHSEYCPKCFHIHDTRIKLVRE